MMFSYSNIYPSGNMNRRRIFDLIYDSKQISRQGIARKLGLSLPTVNQHLDYLFKMNIIHEDGMIESQSVGRKAKAISVNQSVRIALGLDITEHHFSLVAVDIRGNVLARMHEEFAFSDRENCYADLANYTSEFIAKNDWPREAILGLGISLPAIVTEKGKFVEFGLLVDDAHDFYTKFGKYCDLPFTLYNDANAGGFSEIFSHKNTRRLVYLSICHSIGGAIIEGNQIIGGDNSRSGEFGHLILVPDGLKCHCGKRGCANAYCSPDVLAAYADGDLQLFFRRLEAGNPECVKAFDAYLDKLAILVQNIHTCFDCDIVIGGSIAQFSDFYLNRLRKIVQEKDYFCQNASEYLRVCFYPFDASSIGAALFFVADFLNSI